MKPTFCWDRHGLSGAQIVVGGLTLYPGSNDLHSLFLRRTNYVNGRYFAELVKEVFTNNENMQVFTEIRISIYGR